MSETSTSRWPRRGTWTPQPYLPARYFGRRHFSVLYCLTWTAYAIGGASRPLWIGHLNDGTAIFLAAQVPHQVQFVLFMY